MNKHSQIMQPVRSVLDCSTNPKLLDRFGLCKTISLDPDDGLEGGLGMLRLTPMVTSPIAAAFLMSCTTTRWVSPTTEWSLMNVISSPT